jgi:hypothetical protein
MRQRQDHEELAQAIEIAGQPLPHLDRLLEHPLRVERRRRRNPGTGGRDIGLDA